jgi:hypothetical protein
MFFQLVECLAFLICAADSLLAAIARFAGPPPPKVLRCLTFVCTYVSIQKSRVGLHSLQLTHVCAFLFAYFFGLARALHAAYYRRDLGAGGAVRIDAAPTRSASLFSACISASTSGIPSFNRFSLLRSSISPGK